MKSKRQKPTRQTAERAWALDPKTDPIYPFANIDTPPQPAPAPIPSGRRRMTMTDLKRRYADEE